MPRTLFANATDIQVLYQSLRQALDTQGYAHIRTPLSDDTFRQLAHALGAMTSETHIRIDPSRQQAQSRNRKTRHSRPGVYQAEALHLHTDNPQNDVLAWYCVNQDPEDGASLLLDLGEVSSHFSPDELRVLHSIRLWYTTRHPETDVESFIQHPLLEMTHDGARPRVYYVPWLLLEAYSPEQRRVLERFQAYLAHQQQTVIIRIRLAPKESLFIDNHRLLHGREGISAQSARHLIRLYLQTWGAAIQYPAASGAA